MERVNSGLLSLVLMLLSILLLGTPALAWDPATDEDIDPEDQLFYFEGGTYFSVGFSYLNEKFADTIGSTSGEKGFHRVDGNVANAEGINAVFGQRAFGFVAMELQFEFSDGFQFDDEDGEHFDLKVYTTTFNAKILPFHNFLRNENEGRLQPHLLLGVGLMATRDLDIDTGASLAFRYGGGIDYVINEKWAVNLKSTRVRPYGLLKGMKYVSTSLGLTYFLD